LTFDDARADSWTGADGILRKLHFNAVMFVDVGRVDGDDPEYLTWDELATVQDSGHWQLQLHSGKGHTQIRYGSGPDDVGPFYAYKKQGEDFDGWRDRVRSDIAWGQTTLTDHISAYRPLAFTPPYGSYGQDGTTRRSPATSSAGSRSATTPSSPRTSTRERTRGADSRSAASRSPARPPEAACTRCCSPASLSGRRSAHG
jgi:Polysaccharide deacetylase